METGLTLFQNEEFGNLEVMVINGEPWFMGKDVAMALKYSNPQKAVRDHVDDEDKGVNEMDTPGGKQNIVIINESGLYSLIFSSKLDSAKRFKHWVTAEVLPAIRKTGEYSMKKESEPPKKQERPNSYMIEDQIERAKVWIEEQEEKLALESKVEELVPKAEAFDKWIDSQLVVNLRDAAKQIGISQTQFTGWLLDNGYVYRTSWGELRPKERYAHSDLFAMRSYQNGRWQGLQTCVTPRGLATFKTILDMNNLNSYTMKKHGGRNAKLKDDVYRKENIDSEHKSS